MQAIAIAGEGLGNVVMATPAVAALHQMGYAVDLALVGGAYKWASAFEGWKAIASIIQAGGRECVLPARDLVVRTVWGHGPTPHDSSKYIAACRWDSYEMHETRANMDALRRIGWAGPVPAAHVEYSEPTDWCGLAPRQYWVLLTSCNPRKMWDCKRWESWAELAGKLDAPCVFLGADTDSKPWMTVAGLNLCGRVSLRTALGWIAMARGAVGIDCGLAHCAAALGVATTVLYGPTSEQKNRQLGSRVRVMRYGERKCAPCQLTDMWGECKTFACMGHDPAVIAKAAIGEAGA